MALATAQYLAENMYGGITYNFEFKAAAAICLVGFGEAGLRALVESARRTPKSKNVSLCLSILSSVAVGQLPSIAQSVAREGLAESVRTVLVRTPELHAIARRELREYVLSIPDEYTAISAIGSQLHMNMQGSGATARELITALALRALAVSRPTLDIYERLITTAGDDEPAFQSFLEKHPHLLDPMALEVWPRPDLAGAREPDFIIRRRDDTYVIVEIEVPNKPLMTAGNQPSAHATHAIAQATDYRSFLMERFPTAAAHFPHFSEPECLVVIGLERTLTDEQRAALARDNRDRHRLRTVGFDWLAQRAETIAQNVIEAPVTSRSVRMT
ncbi:MAG TPA: Shedu anti-phage system protein SduA domain-containing protein [Gemmatimonadaceae bacterium]|nr:Shedu anti-phage system protein SduA domain-containing protein [Gemmatimonadaceae bacterium]